MNNLIRVDKYLGEMGVASRSQIKRGAKKGKLMINGRIEKGTDIKIDPGQDQVMWEGRKISYFSYEYYMLNKPQGVVSATRDNLYQTVLELIEEKQRSDLFPVGRLDLDTEGLLLITNDGDLSHQLLSPRHHVDKVYEAVVQGRLSSELIYLFEQGMRLTDGTKTLPAKLEILESDGEAGRVRLTIREGKFHQVKRMFEAVNCKVTFLKRIQMGALKLDPALLPGEYRQLTRREIQCLKGRQDVKE